MNEFYSFPQTVADFAKGMYGDSVSSDESMGLRPGMQFFLDYIINKIPHSSVLVDVGCATANTFGMIAPSRGDLQYIGVDLSFPMLANARERFGPEIGLVNGNVDELPLMIGAVEYILCAGTLCYSSDPAAMAEALYHMASRGAMVELLFMPNEDYGATINQRHGEYTNKVRLLSRLELNQLLQRISDICRFEDGFSDSRFIVYDLSNKLSGFSEAGDRAVFGFGAIFERPKTK